MKRSVSGFTLVELAIVITIIGLLIGGVLKGQELLQNARMTGTAAQLKSFATATITFKDIYKAYPGDMISPGNVLQNCTTAPCNVSGNGDGNIGNVYPASADWLGDETNRYWLHLYKAGLISGIDPNSTWTAGTLFTASVPENKMGGRIMIWAREITPDDGLNGKLYYFYQPNAGGTAPTPGIPINVFAKFDLKIDDGRPNSGIAFIDSSGCGVARTDTVYGANNSTPCTYDVKADF